MELKSREQHLGHFDSAGGDIKRAWNINTIFIPWNCATPREEHNEMSTVEISDAKTRTAYRK
jgi:hypothetical protein